MKITLPVLFLLCFIFFFSFQSFIKKEPTTNLSQTEKQTIIHKIDSLLSKNYVFPEMAKKISDLLLTNLKKGTYDDINEYVAFKERITEDLRSINQDTHLRLIYRPESSKENMSERIYTIQDSIAEIEEYKNKLRKQNFGFSELKILDGNVGYLKLNHFHSTAFCGETAVAAMNFLSNSDAIIIDIRNNYGGSPELIQLLTTYFFEGYPIHLNTFIYRPTNERNQTWTLPYVLGKRMPTVKLYILVNEKTFSAAEEFAYNLQSLKRATIIGSKTSGSAHPGEEMKINNNFGIFIPTGRVENSVTHTDWEGVGIIPNVETKSEEALDTAYKLAITEN
ncbi:S41 family peptidase [Bernardetia sp. Wsw4-3y2]|uniref:S41 family peptidase n=1 Tax=Bernardetia sp. Wsw4-3y2 TaxID=3127471 RepID=UPI0030D1AD3A